MRHILIALCALVAVGVDAAHAEERADIARRIVDAQLSSEADAIAKVVDLTAMAMGADRANLTSDEAKSLKTGLNVFLSRWCGTNG